MIEKALQDDLNMLKEHGMLRALKLRTSPVGRKMLINGKPMLNFCSNDYLGLANDVRLVAAAKFALDQDGMGSGASRLVAGNMGITEELEHDIAALKGSSECLVFNSGYAANTGIIAALVGRGDVVIADKLNHASIIDGAILSRAELKRYAHVDMGALEDALKASGQYRRRVIITDSVFSMDGDKAPLVAMIELAKRYDAWVMVDEAHGFGVLGPHGAGLAEELGCSRDIDIHMGTLSKGAGCFGAYACGQSPLRAYLINNARSFIYTTGLPAAVMAAARAAVKIIASSEGKERRLRVNTQAQYLRDGLKKIGFDTLNSTTPIIPVVLKDTAKTVAAADFLYAHGIYISAIRPPTVPVNAARLRITVTAEHTMEDLDMLINVMRRI